MLMPLIDIVEDMDMSMIESGSSQNVRQDEILANRLCNLSPKDGWMLPMSANLVMVTGAGRRIQMHAVG